MPIGFGPRSEHCVLEKVLEAVWWSDSVNQGRVRNLYHSLPVRCSLVVEAEGKITQYWARAR